MLIANNLNFLTLSYIQDFSSFLLNYSINCLVVIKYKFQDGAIELNLYILLIETIYYVKQSGHTITLFQIGFYSI